MEIRDLAAAIRDDHARSALLDGLSAEEADAFEAYVDEFEMSELELKKDKIFLGDPSRRGGRGRSAIYPAPLAVSVR